MTRKERFLATVERRSVDRPASWFGLPVTAALPALYREFGVTDYASLKAAINDDVWAVEVPYDNPPSNHIACAFNFAMGDSGYEERTLTASGVFADCNDVSAVDRFAWPDPAKHMSAARCAAAVAEAPPDYAVMGILWSAHFQDSCAAFGMENAFMTMLSDPEVYKAVDDRVTEFYLAANRIFFEATKGRLDAVLIGNDLGSQRGLMLSPELVRKHVIPNARRLIAQAKSYGVKVVYHSCGAIAPVIGDLISAGVDVVHPIQALATGMDPRALKAGHGGRVSFCGGVDSQELLVRGTPDEVSAKVAELRAIFPTGLVISPSHEAILPDIAPANVAELFKAARAEKYVQWQAAIERAHEWQLEPTEGVKLPAVLNCETSHFQGESASDWKVFVAPWQGFNKPNPRGRKSNPDTTLAVYSMEWKNHRPAVPIAAIDIISVNTKDADYGSPAVLAITTGRAW